MLAEATGLDESILKTLRPEDGLSFEQADHMIENAVGIFGIPIGIACNLTINERDVLVPMATEEPSVVAAASNAARIARVRGGFFTSSTGPIMQHTRLARATSTVSPHRAASEDAIGQFELHSCRCAEKRWRAALVERKTAGRLHASGAETCNLPALFVWLSSC